MRVTTSLLLTLLFLLRATAVDAQLYDPRNGEPPPGHHQHFTQNTWEIKPTPDGEGITGTATLDCYQNDMDVLLLNLKGLQKEKVYSVWLTRKTSGVEERAKVVLAWEGKKTEIFTFTSEHDGTGFYRGCLKTCPLGHWRNVEVRLHPNGNANDLQTSVTVLTAKLKPQ